MNVLFIGGTGTISSACTQLLLERGHTVYLLNRGQSDRPSPAGTIQLTADINDRAAAEKALGKLKFDVVVNWVAFGVGQVEADVRMFGDRTDHYLFISSASAYQKPPQSLPITESTPLHNPFWSYSQAKIACEERLMRAYREQGFPVTIVRPSHTYDRTRLPMFGRYTIIDRMRRGKKIIVHGDGASLWVLTHHADFAKGFVGLLGNQTTIGETFHITSDEVLTWNQIMHILARAAGTTANIVHLPSQLIAGYDANWGISLIGDKSHSVIFDNSKIKRFVPDFVATIPFSQGAAEVMAWFDADPARQVVDPAVNQLIDRMLAVHESLDPRMMS